MRRAVNWGELLAFAAIYLLWGGTFLAVRVAVLAAPPLFTAATRFFVAGGLLYGFMRWRGEPRPSLGEWRNLALIGLLMFTLTYGALFWGEQYVSSGMTAILEASLPIMMIAMEVLIFRMQPFQWRVLSGVVIGFAGVVMLMVHNEAQRLPILPCLVILTGGIAWSLGTVLSRRLTLPAARPLNAGAEMMLGGVMLFAWSLVAGELRSFPPINLRWLLALGYLVVFGSIVGYTSYVWLLGRFSATRVSSHAYVNPLVALALGYFVAGEIVTLRSLLACGIIVLSVVLIVSPKGKVRIRLPVAAKIALANAGATGGTSTSPTPLSGRVKSSAATG
jgi:drug/metabolite transporter (DMT)-like permease